MLYHLLGNPVIRGLYGHPVVLVYGIFSVLVDCWILPYGVFVAAAEHLVAWCFCPLSGLPEKRGPSMGWNPTKSYPSMRKHLDCLSLPLANTHIFTVHYLSSGSFLQMHLFPAGMPGEARIAFPP